MSKIPSETTKTINEGTHKGKVLSIDETSDQFDYINVNVQIQDVDGKPTLRYGMPSNVTVTPDGKPASKLARFITLLGFDASKDLDTDELREKLDGIECEVITRNETGERGTFAQIIDDAISFPQMKL